MTTCGALWAVDAVRHPSFSIPLLLPCVTTQRGPRRLPRAGNIHHWHVHTGNPCSHRRDAQGGEPPASQREFVTRAEFLCGVSPPPPQKFWLECCNVFDFLVCILCLASFLYYVAGSHEEEVRVPLYSFPVCLCLCVCVCE